jgi:hypothetical protein
MEQIIKVNGRKKTLEYDLYKWGLIKSLPDDIKSYLPKGVTHASVRVYHKPDVKFIDFQYGDGKQQSRVVINGELAFGGDISHLSPCGFNSKGHFMVVSNKLKGESVVYIMDSNLNHIHSDKYMDINTSTFAEFDCFIKSGNDKCWLIDALGKKCSIQYSDIYLTAIYTVTDDSVTAKFIYVEAKDGSSNYLQNGNYSDYVFSSNLKNGEVLLRVRQHHGETIHDTTNKNIWQPVKINTRGNQ